MSIKISKEHLMTIKLSCLPVMSEFIFQQISIENNKKTINFHDYSTTFTIIMDKSISLLPHDEK